VGLDLLRLCTRLSPGVGYSPFRGGLESALVRKSTVSIDLYAPSHPPIAVAREPGFGPPVVYDAEYRVDPCTTRPVPTPSLAGVTV